MLQLLALHENVRSTCPHQKRVSKLLSQPRLTPADAQEVVTLISENCNFPEDMDEIPLDLQDWIQWAFGTRAAQQSYLEHRLDVWKQRTGDVPGACVVTAHDEVRHESTDSTPQPMKPRDYIRLEDPHLLTVVERQPAMIFPHTLWLHCNQRIVFTQTEDVSLRSDNVGCTSGPLFAAGHTGTIVSTPTALSTHVRVRVQNQRTGAENDVTVKKQWVTVDIRYGQVNCTVRRYQFPFVSASGTRTDGQHFAAVDEMYTGGPGSPGVATEEPNHTHALDKKVRELHSLWLCPGMPIEFTRTQAELGISRGQIGVIETLPRDANNPKALLRIRVQPNNWQGFKSTEEFRSRPWTTWRIVEVPRLRTDEDVKYHHAELKRVQFPVRLYGTVTIHATMGDTQTFLGTQITDRDWEHRLWMREQLTVIVTRTCALNQVFFLGRKDETLRSVRCVRWCVRFNGIRYFVRSKLCFCEHKNVIICRHVYQMALKRTMWLEASLDRVQRLTQPCAAAHQQLGAEFTSFRYDTNHTVDMGAYPYKLDSSVIPLEDVGWCYLLSSLVSEFYFYNGECPNLLQRFLMHNSATCATTKFTGRSNIDLRPWILRMAVTGFPGMANDQDNKRARKQFE